MYHNGHGFLYKVSWREAGARDARWNSAEVKSPPFLVQKAGTYTPFEIKVQALNSLGAGPEPEPEIGHSGEDSRSRFTSSQTGVADPGLGGPLTSRVDNRFHLELTTVIAIVFLAAPLSTC